MNAIIFSKNRAMQLDCLLRSIYEHCNIFYAVSVIYKTDFKESYQILKDNYPAVNWIEEINFADDLCLEIVVYESNYICLLVDDDIFFRDVDNISLNEMMTEVDIVSLRLGRNVTKQMHFNYKGSIDGNVYRRKFLLKLFKKGFTNPNKLESKLVQMTSDMTMGWFNESKLIGIPANKVSDSSTCSDMGISVEELDERFLKGERINYKAMNLESTNVHKNETYAYFMG